MQLFVGTYTQTSEHVSGQGDGIYSVPFDTVSGAFGAPKLRAKYDNPSWLELASESQTLFAVQESFQPNDAAIHAFHISAKGDFSQTSSLPIQGDSPCHLAYDPIHNRLASAQYGSGEVALFSCNNTLEIQTDIAGSGFGPNTTRQKGPHAHYVTFTNQGNVLHTVDLGADVIHSHRLNANGHVVDSASLVTPAGSGPRHLAVNRTETRAWALCELNETLLILRRSGLGWVIEKSVFCFAGEHTINGAAGAIHLSPDERFVYVSGRTQSCIAGFNTDGTPIGEVETGGDFPRDFMISTDGKWLVAANQLGNSLTSFQRDQTTGMLKPTGHRCDIGSPVCVKEA